MQKYIEYLFFSFTFLSFIAPTYSPPWTSSSMEFFSFLAAVALFFSIPLKNQKIFISKSFIFIAFIVFISFVSHSIQPHKETIWIVFLYGIFFIIYSNSIKIKEIDFHHKILLIFIAVGIFNSHVIFSQYFSIYSSELGIWIADYESTHGRPYGNFGQPNLAATLLLTSLCSSIFLYQKKKLGISTLTLIAVFFGCALAFPSSKTSFLCLLVLLIAAIFYKDKVGFFIFAVTSAAIFITKSLIPSTRDLSSNDISTGRFELWHTMLDALWQSPWFGYGALNTRIAHFQSRELDITPHGQVIGSSHNLLLDFLIWFGVIIGLILIILFLYIIFDYFKKYKNSSHNIYLLFPILIHSQLEYPLFYANFLFVFAFILNRTKTDEKFINSSSLAYLTASAGIVILSIASFEYYKISQRFTELRFYNNNFLNAQKPEPISLIALDLTGGQYNAFLKTKINNEKDLNSLIDLTKSMPSLRNYSLIIQYLRKNNRPQAEIDFWLMKARASFSEAEMRTLER